MHQENCGAIGLSGGSFSGMLGSKLGGSRNPTCPLRSAAFNIHILDQVEQQGALGRTVNTFRTNVYCLSETRL